MALSDAPSPRSETNRIGFPAAVIAASVAARLVSLHGLHPLNWDEIEFFRATDWVGRGLVPYRDFWEHHTPLQWFLFAPFTALTRSPGADAIILMRWAQLPLWAAMFALMNTWMRDTGISRHARWSGMAVALTSTLFMLPAVEYRVDVLAGALFVLGLVCMQRMERGIYYTVAAGAAFCLAAFANVRLAPVIAFTMLVGIVAGRGRWAVQRRSAWMFGGAVATLLLWVLYFVFTGSAAIAVRRLVVDNYLADRYAQGLPGFFWHRVLAPFGIRVVFMENAFGVLHRLVTPFGLQGVQLEGIPWFSASAIDPGGITLLIVGTIGMIRALRQWRGPDALFVLSIVQIVNLVFIASMKFVFNYHLEIPGVLMVPFVAAEFQRLRRQWIVTAILCVTVTVNVAVALCRGKEDDTRYQNLIMREVDARTPPGALVWDGVGWAIRHPPAYRYWFLRMIVTVLEGRGRFEPYRIADVMANPPAAIIADHDARLWMLRHPPLGRFMTAHYLPLWRDLWLPGLSARLTPARPAVEWVVPADGIYRVFASRRLAAHPWFEQPLFFETRSWHDPRLVSLTAADRASVSKPPLLFSSQPDGDLLTLRKSERLRCTLTASDSIGVMLLRDRPEEMFRQPPASVSIEASSSPQWHVPDLSALTYSK